MRNLKIPTLILLLLGIVSFFFIKREDDLSEHIVLTFLTTGNPPQSSANQDVLDELNKVLTRKVNAEIKMKYVPWNNYIEEYNTILGKKDGSIDLAGTATDWLEAWPNAQRGVFKSLSWSKLKKYAPLTFASISPEKWEACKLNGKIYFIPEDNYAQWTNHGFMYRRDWAKEAGFVEGIHSWETLTKYFEYVRKNKKSVIPWDTDGIETISQTNGYIISKSDFIPLDGFSSNHLFGIHKNNTGKVYSPYLEGQELIDYAKLMYYWNSIGVWRADFNSETKYDNREEFYQGKSSVEQHHTQSWFTLVCPQMQKRQPGSDCSFFWFGEEMGNIVRTTITHGATAVSAASKNPERALKVFDLLRNDAECYYLLNYGIKGRQYIINKDGYRTRPIGFREERDSISLNFWWGRNDNLELRDAESSWDKYDQITEVYNRKAIDYPLNKIVWDTTNISSELIELDKVWKAYMPSICFGKSENPETYIESFRQALKLAGIETVINELQLQLNAFYAKNKR